MARGYYVMKCPECNDRPCAVKLWHDKEDRSMNHLPWSLTCQCRACGARGSSQREVISLHNSYAQYLKDLKLSEQKPKASFLRKMLDRLFNCVKMFP